MTPFLPFPCTKLRHLIGFTKKNAPFYVSFCHIFVIILMFANAFSAFCKTHVASATPKRDTLQGAVLRACLLALYAENPVSLRTKTCKGESRDPPLREAVVAVKVVISPSLRSSMRRRFARRWCGWPLKQSLCWQPRRLLCK